MKREASIGFKSKLESEGKQRWAYFWTSLLGLVAVFHLWSGRTSELPVSMTSLKLYKKVHAKSKY